MKPYYQDDWVTQYCSDALTVLRGLESDTVDLLCTDPPYGISFMGKAWDKALPDKRIWAECLRVLKPGAFAFVMSIPRSDCLSRMIISLEDAGFRVDFSPIYHAFASGFPKAQNIGKAVDKRLGAEREKYLAPFAYPDSNCWGVPNKNSTGENKNPTSYKIPTEKGKGNVGGLREYSLASTPQAKALDGSYGGFQPKPSVEIVIVAMKPLSEKTFVDQALSNGKGITWLDDCRVPTEENCGRPQGSMPQPMDWGKRTGLITESNPSGRFPANLLVSDDVLNDGRVSKSAGHYKNPHDTDGAFFGNAKIRHDNDYAGDSGSFSRYFDLDKWTQKTFPFLIVPKASKSEKNKGCEDLPQTSLPKRGAEKRLTVGGSRDIALPRGNIHPTCKPLKLMSYLVTLGSRAGDTVIDPFGGSGTTALASKLLGRHCIIIEIEEKYCQLALERNRQQVLI